MGFYVVGSAVCFGFKLSYSESQDVSRPFLEIMANCSYKYVQAWDRCFREWKVWSQSCLGQLRQVTFMVLARRSIGMRMALQMQA